MNDPMRPIVGIENRTAQEVFDIMCDRYRAALEAAQPQWQPIETAPKDGTRILAWFTPRFSRAGAIDFHEKPYSDAEPHWAILYFAHGLWQTGDNSRPVEIKYWLPLPTPPAQEGE